MTICEHFYHTCVNRCISSDCCSSCWPEGVIENGKRDLDISRILLGCFCWLLHALTDLFKFDLITVLPHSQQQYISVTILCEKARSRHYLCFMFELVGLIGFLFKSPALPTPDQSMLVPDYAIFSSDQAARRTFLSGRLSVRHTFLTMLLS